MARRRFGLVTEISPGYDSVDRADIVRVLQITEAQTSGNEYNKQVYIQSKLRYSPEYYCYIKNVGYVGPTFKYSDYHTSIATRSPRMTNIMLQIATVNNQYCQVQSFSLDLRLLPDQIQIFITNNCYSQYRSTYFDLLFGVTALGETEDDEDILQQHELPAVPMAGQITAIVKACQCVDENMLPTMRKIFDSEVFTIIGPAGTGRLQHLDIS